MLILEMNEKDFENELPTSDEANGTDTDENSSISSDDADSNSSKSTYECISCAIALKDAGNASFKSQNMDGAKQNYDDALKAIDHLKDQKPPVISEEEYKEIRELLICLHGNKAMVGIKIEDYKMALDSSLLVLSLDADNVKAHFRKGMCHSKFGDFDNAKSSFTRVLELDPSNTSAKKELIEVQKQIKASVQKEKAAFGNIFSKGSIYEDKEKERLKKLKQEEEEKLRLQDEWKKSNIERRETGLGEQTFEDWKKELDKKKEEEEKSNKGSQKMEKKARSSERKKSKTSEAEIDEEDAKILAETKAKGYCYFKKNPCKFSSNNSVF